MHGRNRWKAFLDAEYETDLTAAAGISAGDFQVSRERHDFRVLVAGLPVSEAGPTA